MRFRWKWIFSGSLRPTVTASGGAILNGEATVAAMASRVRLAARSSSSSSRCRCSASSLARRPSSRRASIRSSSGRRACSQHALRMVVGAVGSTAGAAACGGLLLAWLAWLAWTLSKCRLHREALHVRSDSDGMSTNTLLHCGHVTST